MSEEPISMEQWLEAELKDIRHLADMSQLSLKEMFLGVLHRGLELVEAKDAALMAEYLTRLSALVGALSAIGIPTYQIILSDLSAYLGRGNDEEAVLMRAAEAIRDAYNRKPEPIQ